MHFECVSASHLSLLLTDFLLDHHNLCVEAINFSQTSLLVGRVGLRCRTPGLLRRPKHFPGRRLQALGNFGESNVSIKSRR
jgi:hypothetical protein